MSVFTKRTALVVCIIIIAQLFECIAYSEQVTDDIIVFQNENYEGNFLSSFDITEWENSTDRGTMGTVSKAVDPLNPQNHVITLDSINNTNERFPNNTCLPLYQGEMNPNNGGKYENYTPENLGYSDGIIAFEADAYFKSEMKDYINGAYFMTSSSRTAYHKVCTLDGAALYARDDNTFSVSSNTIKGNSYIANYNEWHKFTIIYHCDTKYADYYVDGTLVWSAPASTNWKISMAVGMKFFIAGSTIPADICFFDNVKISRPLIMTELKSYNYSPVNSSLQLNFSTPMSKLELSKLSLKDENNIDVSNLINSILLSSDGKTAKLVLDETNIQIGGHYSVTIPGGENGVKDNFCRLISETDIENAAAFEVTEYSASYDLKYNKRFKQIVVSGVTDAVSQLYNPYISVLSYTGDKLYNFNQSVVDKDGNYRCSIGLKDGIPNDLTIKLKIGDRDIVDTSPQFVLESDDLKEIRYETEGIADGKRYFVDLTEISRETDNYNIVIAQYDENNRLISSERYLQGDIQSGRGKYYLDKIISTVGASEKVFVWSSTKTMVPYAVTEKGFSLNFDELLISFGNKDDLTEEAGYASTSLSGNNNYEIYKNAVAELPDEFEQVQPVDIEQTYEIYVSPDGKDTNSGTKEKPLRTIKKAVELYNKRSEIYRKYWTTIYLMGGEYFQNEKVIINDTNTKDGSAKLKVCAYNNEEVKISSNKSFDGNVFKKVTQSNTNSDTINRINDKARDNLYYCTYEDLGIEGFNGFNNNNFNKPSLLWNNEEMLMARYPNTYKNNVGQVIEDGKNDDGTIGDIFSVIPNDEQFKSWKDTGEICLWSQMSVTWANSDCVISISDGKVTGPAKNLVSQIGSYVYPVAVKPTNDGVISSTMYFYNVLEEIDMEGEWCCDSSEHRIYFYIPDGETENRIVSVTSNNIDEFFNVSNVSDVVFDGIDFSQNNRAIEFNNCSDSIIQNCIFKNITGNPVDILDSYKCGVIYSDFYQCGTAVSISRNQDDWDKLLFDRNFVQNCHAIGGGIAGLRDSNGNVISHNLTENSIGSAVGWWHGSENIIEYNEFRSCGLVGNEGGVVYINGHVDSMYNHIRYNNINSTRPDGSNLNLNIGVSADDMEEGLYIYKNVFREMKDAVGFNCGDNNIVDENVFLSCVNPVLAGNGMYANGFMGMNRETNNSLSEGRLFGYFYSEGLSDSDKWKNRYPKLYKYIDYSEALFDSWKAGDETFDNSPCMDFFKKATGIYVINNIFASADHSTDLSVSGVKIYSDDDEDLTTYGFLSDDEKRDLYIQDTNPDDAVEQYNNMDYNVVYNNDFNTTGYDLSKIPYYNKIGTDITEEYGDSIPVIYKTRDDSAVDCDYLDLYWKNVKGANYYKVTVAYDPEFKSIYSNDILFDNFMHKKIARSGFIDKTYYYKIEAISAKYENKSTPLAATIGSATFSKSSENCEKILLTGNESIGMNSWSTLRVYQDNRPGISSQIYTHYGYLNDKLNYVTSVKNDDEGEYFNFKGSGYVRKSSYQDDYLAIGRGVESNTSLIGPNTIINAEGDFRLPNAENMPEVASPLWLLFELSSLAPNSNTIDRNKYNASVGFNIDENNDGTYTIYAMGYDGMLWESGNTTRVPIRSFTSEELFGTWFHVAISADMETGVIEYTLNNQEFVQINMLTRQARSPYNAWNEGFYLRGIEFAANSLTMDAVSEMDIKNVKASRSLKE